MDIGMSELLLIGIVALIVIGPRDLPEMFRQLGRMTAKMRAMAREFNRAMEQAANESGVKDVAKDLRAITSPKAMGLNAVKDAVDKFEKWDPIKNAAKPSSPAAVGAKPLVPAPMPVTPVPVSAEVVAAPVPEIMGPNTAALYEKQAARAAILQDSVDKLKALDSAPAAPAAAVMAKAPRKKKADPAVVAAMVEVPVKPERAPRKKKAADA